MESKNKKKKLREKATIKALQTWKARADSVSESWRVFK